MIMIVLRWRLVFLLLTLWDCVLADFRNVLYDDIKATAQFFSDSKATTYSQLLFDNSRNQLIVGARDWLFRLSLDNLDNLEEAPYFSTVEKIETCQNKGQSEEDCHNYVKVLLSNGRRLFTCGTYAFSPHCTWREIEDINNIVEEVPGMAKCPYSPHSNVTALMTRTGQYFVGTTLDFSGADPAIIRNLKSEDPFLRTNQYNSKWLNEPQFVGSFEDEKFVYFLFREAAVEYINCGKIVYSRIARVCKNDEGGHLMLKDNWTTFLKARLNCSLPGDYPFYFDEIQGMVYNEEEKVVYATFTTPRNSIPGSAICAFNMSAIEAAFAGAFKHQANPGAAWERHQVPHGSHFECRAKSRTEHLLDSSRYQLMDLAVQGTTVKPLYHSSLETLTHIAVDVLPTRLHNQFHILYVATTDGKVKKISVLPRTLETCIVEIWNPGPVNTALTIHTLKFLKETNSVYLGTNTGVVKIPVQHCNRHKTRSSCSNAMDPHCGWNELKLQCTPAPDDNPLTSHWYQAVTECPVLNVKVDGGWGSWSDWFVCSQYGEPVNGKEENSDKCKCRLRECNNPAPQNGGAPCSGVSISVTNCTVHGGWTSWSSWSQCSQSCGIAVKTRHRTCGNPAPAHGGRVCVGQDVNEMYCTMNPPCPTKTTPPRDGQWSEWSDWEECSAPCGGGFRIRKRKCDNPPPLNGGQDCPGCHLDFEKCNTHPCHESKRLSAWTPWMMVSNGSSRSGGYTERRVRFSCKAPIPDPGLIKITQAKEEERYCHSDGSCTRNGRASDTDDTWGEWSAWSACTKQCGGGVRERTRTCDGRDDDCEGSNRQSMPCNTQKCKGEWSCWTDWSACSVSCDNGIQTRTRQCLNVDTSDDGGTYCDGSPIAQRPCEMPSCSSVQGWDEWTEWSICDLNHEQHRRRKCLTNNPGPQLCQGRDIQARMCVDQIDLSNEISPLGVSSSLETKSAGVNVGIVLGCSVAAFVFGLVAAMTSMYYYQKRKKTQIPGSPHYITSKQNPYVTVPLREPPKRSPSSASSNGSTYKAANGTAPKIFQKQVDYETATIKRNSHGLLNGRTQERALEEEKFF